MPYEITNGVAANTGVTRGRKTNRLKTSGNCYSFTEAGSSITLLLTEPSTKPHSHPQPTQNLTNLPTRTWHAKKIACATSATRSASTARRETSMTHTTTSARNIETINVLTVVQTTGGVAENTGVICAREGSTDQQPATNPLAFTEFDNSNRFWVCCLHLADTQTPAPERWETYNNYKTKNSRRHDTLVNQIRVDTYYPKLVA